MAFVMPTDEHEEISQGWWKQHWKFFSLHILPCFDWLNGLHLESHHLVDRIISASPRIYPKLDAGVSPRSWTPVIRDLRKSIFQRIPQSWNHRVTKPTSRPNGSFLKKFLQLFNTLSCSLIIETGEQGVLRHRGWSPVSILSFGGLSFRMVNENSLASDHFCR